MRLRPGLPLWELYQTAWNQSFVLMASTQSEKTELAIRTLIAHCLIGLSQIFVSSDEQQRNTLISDRVDPVLSTPFFQPLVQADADNKSYKRINGVGVRFVGSHSPASFVSFSADVLTIDELDLCKEENIPMAVERLSASEFRLVRLISNPTIEGRGIALEYSKTDRRRWFIRCLCKHWFHPDFFRHVVREADRRPIDPHWSPGGEPRLICDKCGRPIDRNSPGEWVAEFPSIPLRGYHLSKLFTTRVSLAEIFARWIDGLANASIAQRVYNGDLGLPFSATGASISREMLLGCIDPEYIPEIPDVAVMGIDPGARIHFTIFRPVDRQRMDLVKAGYCQDETEILDLIKEHNVKMAVIDANPEIQLVRRLQQRFRNMIRCIYLSSSPARTEWQKRTGSAAFDEGRRKVQINRTYVMDWVREMFIRNLFRLPGGAQDIDGGDLFAHLCAPTRVFDESRNQHIWTEGSRRDDYFHAIVYAVLARNLLFQVARK